MTEKGEPNQWDVAWREGYAKALEKTLGVGYRKAWRLAGFHWQPASGLRARLGRWLLRGSALPVIVVAFLLLGLAPAAGAAPFNDATLAVSPNPAVFTDSNAYFEFAGCGYDPDTGVQINVQGPEALSFFGGPTVDGCIDITWNGFVTGPGTYGVTAVQQYVRGQTVHSVLRAEATLVVTE